MSQLTLADEQIWAGTRRLITVTPADRYRALLAFGVKDSVAAAMAIGLVTTRVKVAI